MGQCGCGDMNLTAAYPVAGTDAVLGIDEYWGCRECGTPLGIVVLLFDPKGREEWVEVSGLKLGPAFEAGEYGGGPAGELFGLTLPFVGQDDLVAAVREGEELKNVRLEDYETLADLLSDWGLELLQEAFAHRKRQMKQGA